MNISRKYIVKLSARERRQVQGIMRKGTHQAQVVKRAAVLWKSHRGMKDEDIAAQVDMSERNISRIRKRYAIHGLTRALYDAPRPGRKPVMTQKAEAQLVAIACSLPPQGSTHWTLELLREKMLKEKTVEHISTVAIWHHLTNQGIKPWREKNVGDPDPHSRVY
jgi:transposase